MRCKSVVMATLAAILAAGLAIPLRPTVVLGHSMEPTLRPGGLYVLNTAYYRHHPIRRGDLVVFRHQGETCTKRVYALPGDRILLLRDEDGAEDQIVAAREVDALRRLESARRLQGQHLETLTVPSGQYFMLGDNQPVSYDSRSFGCIPISEILGRVAL